MDKDAQKTGWLKHLSTQKKMILAFGAMLLVLLAGTMTFLVVEKESADARDWVEHTHLVLENLDQILVGAINQESGMRGYVITSDEKFIVPYKAGAEIYAKAFTEVRTLTSDNAIQQARLVELDSVMHEWHTVFADPDIQWASQPATHELAFKSVESGEGMKRMSRMRIIVKDMQDAERALLIVREKRTADYEAISQQIAYGLMVIGILICLLSVRMVRLLVTQPLMNITDLMTRLADHDHSIEIPDTERRDEIGALARALKVFKKMALDIHEQSWVKSQVTEVSARLQADTSHRQFGETLSSQVTPLLGASLAAFYQLEDNDKLQFVAGYGYREHRESARNYRIGEGLVGQCAREKKVIVLKELPDDYLRISSSLGEARPRCVILLPVLSGSRVRGVIEFGSFAPFTELHQRFLNELMPILALSLENLSRAIKTQQLLDETQAQAEELAASEESLKAQQEELRVSNEQLEQQSRQLRASEEELRVQAEELRISNDQMQHKTETLNQQKQLLEQLQIETQTKADELAQASRYKSEFLANMSHELRTPLNSMLILSKSLADNEGGNLDDDQQEAARIVNESGNNLLRLINDILDLSKVEAGKMEVFIETVELQAFSASIERNFRHVAQARSIDFHLQLSSELPISIEQDGAKISQIVNNLLSNAFKFTANGGVTLTIRKPSAEETLDGVDPDQIIAFSVSDTGIGIPSDKLDRVFEAFKQVDGTTSRKYGGTGLGLSISMGLARLLGGDIRLQSVEGQGACFTLLLPPAQKKAAPLRQHATTVSTSSVVIKTPATVVTPPALIPTLPKSDKPLILVIEDDPHFAKILADSTRKRGCEVIIASDGESGFSAAVAHCPTGIILDVALPGMDGFAVMEQLKANPATRHIPVHFISAQDESLRGLGLGAVGYLVKPVSKQAINQAFDKVLHFAKGAPRKLLLVDDDEGSRRAVQTLIDMPDVTIVEAHDGAQGLAKLREQDFDCVILDLMLNDMDGMEFLKQATRNGRLPPVVIYSAKSLSAEETMDLRQYTDSIVIKSARSPERLLDEVTLFVHSIRDAHTPAAKIERASTSDLVGKIALIVDDDMRNVFALSRAMRNRGLNVVMAEDGYKAIAQLEQNPLINIVLMDIMMPGMDGYATMREIRKRGQWQKLPIIAVSAKAMLGDREKCIEAGADDYMAKPIDIDKLISMMRVLL